MQAQKVVSLDVIFLGGCGNGKTYFLHKYANKQQNPKPHPTIGIDCRMVNINLNKTQNITVQLWDSCGVERVDSITRTYIEQIKIQHFVVFADVTKDYELKNVKRFLRLIEDSCPDKDNARILIIANKMDAISQIGIEMLQSLKKNFVSQPCCTLELVSCKDDFLKAKNVVEGFLKKCYKENYRIKVAPKIGEFIKGLGLQSQDAHWLSDQAKRSAIQKTFKQRFARNKNKEESMILSLFLSYVERSEALLEEERECLQLQQSKLRLLLVENEKLQRQTQEKEGIIAQILEGHQKEHQEQVLKLMEYEYWIVEVDRLLHALAQPIATSPFTHKFLEFSQFAQQINYTIELQMGSWEVHSDSQNLAGSFIESGIEAPAQSDKRERSQRRAKLYLKVQKLQQILEELIPPF